MTTKSATQLSLVPAFAPAPEGSVDAKIDRLAAIKVQMDRLKKEDDDLRSEVKTALGAKGMTDLTTVAGNSVCVYVETSTKADKEKAEAILDSEIFEALFATTAERAKKALTTDEFKAIFREFKTNKIRLS